MIVGRKESESPENSECNQLGLREYGGLRGGGDVSKRFKREILKGWDSTHKGRYDYVAGNVVQCC